jgi:hypothetical protein
MEPLVINVKSSKNFKQKILIEIDADKFERLAANLGFFGPEFLKSLNRAEKDYRAGRTRKIKSLKELRK